MPKQAIASAPAAPAPAPRLRKRERTRVLLIDAAVQVLARRGVGAASVLEITNTANVSNGTFYLHFKDKNEIVNVAAFYVAHEIARKIYEAEQEISDIERRSAYAVRQFITSVIANPPWAWTLLNAHSVMPELRKYAREYMLRTLHQGIRQGAFDIEASQFQIESLHTVVMMSIRVQLEGSAGTEATEEAIEMVLRMLGVDRKRAKKIAAETNASPAMRLRVVAERPAGHVPTKRAARARR
jgi:AcrR family transcriptional regulator